MPTTTAIIVTTTTTTLSTRGRRRSSRLTTGSMSRATSAHATIHPTIWWAATKALRSTKAMNTPAVTSSAALGVKRTRRAGGRAVVPVEPSLIDALRPAGTGHGRTVVMASPAFVDGEHPADAGRTHGIIAV